VLTGRRGYEFDHVFQRVRQLGLASRIRHIGHVSQDDMPALYTLATALVVPSLFESVSIPIFEAFRCGTPVCASAIQALPEQVGDAGILFDPSSAESMAAAMRSILTDEVLRDELRRRGWERITSLTHQRFAEDIRSILARIT
jgi:glycosyltransferase involved in cell wall biosynthesis